MLYLNRLRNVSGAYWSGLLGALLIICPAIRYGPWIPFCDIIGFVGIDSYPPKLSYGPHHYYIFESTYILPMALSRVFTDFGVTAAFQVFTFYIAQALIVFVVIWRSLQLLIPDSLGKQVFWDGLFLWGGPLAYSLAATLVLVATYLSLREAANPSHSTFWPSSGLVFAAVVSHPFALPFGLILFGTRILFLRRSRVASLGVCLLLLVYQSVITKENPESDAVVLVSQLFNWYPAHLGGRIASLFTVDIQTTQALFGIRPTFLSIYFAFLGFVHLLGFLGSPVMALLAKDKPALRMLSTINAITLILYLLADDNTTVISVWPQRILTFYSGVTYLAGAIGACALMKRIRLPVNSLSFLNQPFAFKLLPLALLSAFIILVQVPILRLGRNVGTNANSLREMILATGVHDALLVTGKTEIYPDYLRASPFLLFGDPQLIKRNILFFTEWHHQPRHPSRIGKNADKDHQRFAIDFFMDSGLISFRLTPLP